MSNPFGSYESQCDDFVDSFQEHCDFEAGAENMEHRAMRLEAERDAHQEAMFAGMDEEDARAEAKRVALAPPVCPGDGLCHCGRHLVGCSECGRMVRGADLNDDGVCATCMDFGDDDIPF